MRLQLHKFTALSTTSWVRDRPDWTGWIFAGLNPWPLNLLTKSTCSIQRVEKDGWVDFFLGKAVDAPANIHSILEGESKVGLHFCPEDAYHLCNIRCPSTEIPAHLWQQFTREIVEFS